MIRRQFDSSSPSASYVKKQPFTPLSEDKMLDAVVLKYQNQKLHKKLETQKIEHVSLSHKLFSFKERQHQYDGSLSVVNKSWKELVDDLECRSTQTKEYSCRKDAAHSLAAEVMLVNENFTNDLSIHQNGTVLFMRIKRDSSLLKHAFLRRLSETGATESSSTNSCSEQMEVNPEAVGHKLRNVSGNIVAAIDNMWYFKDEVSSICFKTIIEDGKCYQKISTDSVMEVTNLRSTLCDLHLRHRSLGVEMHNHCDLDAKNKADLKLLQRELESTVKELKDIKFNVASLKAERDATKGAFFPVLDMTSKHVFGDRARDKQKDLQDMESMLKELMGEASVRLSELKNLHKERIRVLKKLTSLQLVKSKAEISHYQALYEKLQNERDTVAWLEKEVNLKNELVDVSRGSSSVDDHREAELRIGIQKQIDRRNIINARLAEGSRDPGRKEIIAEFKAMALSFHKNTNLMQKQLNKHKDTASGVHSLQGDVQALTFVLDRKAQEMRTLGVTAAAQADEIKNLQSVVDGLKVSESS